VSAFSAVVQQFAAGREAVEANYQDYRERRQAEAVALATEIDLMLDKRRGRKRKFAQ
jgi:hypothetical protein